MSAKAVRHLRNLRPAPPERSEDAPKIKSAEQGQGLSAIPRNRSQQVFSQLIHAWDVRVPLEYTLHALRNPLCEMAHDVHAPSSVEPSSFHRRFHDVIASGCIASDGTASNPAKAVLSTNGHGKTTGTRHPLVGKRRGNVIHGGQRRRSLRTES